jgi:tight adherence protein C
VSEVDLSAVLVFLSVLLGLLGISAAQKGDSGRLRLWRIKSSQRALADSDGVEDQTGILFGETSPLIRKLAATGAAESEEKMEQSSKLRRRLIRAGYRRRDAPTIYSVLRIFGSAAAGVFAFVAMGMRGPDDLSAIGLGVVSALGFYLGPSIFLDKRIKARQSSIDRELPAAVDLLAVSVDAGMSTNQAIARVANEFRRISPELSEELELVSKQVSAGRTNADSMRDLAERVGSRDLAQLVSMLIQTERFGTNVADALRAHGDEMRTFRLQAAEERAGKAATLMLMPTSLIMVSILVMILGLGAIKASELLG